MYMESECLVTAKSEQAIDSIMAIWGVSEKEDNYSFEDFDVQIFDVMEKVIKLVHSMETTGQKDEFSIVGKCQSDYDCIIFAIEYAGDEPQIKASQADPEENEARYYQYLDAQHNEIPKLLKRNKNRTFKQAIRDELPLGGFLNVNYDEWIESVLGK